MTDGDTDSPHIAEGPTPDRHWDCHCPPIESPLSQDWSEQPFCGHPRALRNGGRHSPSRLAPARSNPPLLASRRRCSCKVVTRFRALSCSFLLLSSAPCFCLKNWWILIKLIKHDQSWSKLIKKDWNWLKLISMKFIVGEVYLKLYIFLWSAVNNRNATVFA